MSSILCDLTECAHGASNHPHILSGLTTSTERFSSTVMALASRQKVSLVPNSSMEQSLSLNCKEA
jgi:hypothetical protein